MLLHRHSSLKNVCIFLFLATTWEAAYAESPDDEKTAIVHVRTTRPGTTISNVTGRASVVGANTAAGAVAWEDICKAPCSFRVEPGLTELAITRDAPGVATQMQLVEGENYVVVKPGSTAGFWAGYLVATLGVSAAVTGGLFLAMDKDSAAWSLPTTLIGAAGVGGGYALMKMSRSSIEMEQPPPAELRQRIFTLRGTF